MQSLRSLPVADATSDKLDSRNAGSRQRNVRRNQSTREPQPSGEERREPGQHRMDSERLFRAMARA